MRDPYETLEIAPGASPAEIKTAWRRLAKAFHPDKNGGDQRAEARFKEVARAYEILSDPARRAALDRDAVHRASSSRAGAPPDWANWGAPSFMDDGFSAIFEEIFRAQRSAGAANGSRTRGFVLALSVREALEGGRRRLAMPDGRVVELRVPKDAKNGAVLKGRRPGARRADVPIHLRVPPHAFSASGADVGSETEVSLETAVLGGKVSVETVDGPVVMTIPPGAAGLVLRLAGRGLSRPGGSRGDQLVRLRIVLPPQDPELVSFLARRRGR